MFSITTVHRLILLLIHILNINLTPVELISQIDPIWEGVNIPAMPGLGLPVGPSRHELGLGGQAGDGEGLDADGHPWGLFFKGHLQLIFYAKTSGCFG